MKMTLALPQHFPIWANDNNYNFELINDFIKTCCDQRNIYKDTLECVDLYGNLRVVLGNELRQIWVIKEWLDIEFVFIKNSRVTIHISGQNYVLLWTNDLAVKLYPLLHSSDMVCIYPNLFIPPRVLLQLQSEKK